MDAFKVFRALIWAFLALSAANIAAIVLEPKPPMFVDEWFMTDGARLMNSLFSMSNLGLAIVGLLATTVLIGFIVALIGLLFLKRWARLPFIVTTLVFHLSFPLLGHTYRMPIQGMFDAMSYACLGAILVMLFLEPIRGRLTGAPAGG